MGRLRHHRQAIVLGGVLLLTGTILIARTGRLADLAVPSPVRTTGGQQATPPVAAAADPERRGPARKIAQDLVAPPQLETGEIERVEPRPPLSDLGLAVPPKTPMPQDWREVLLYRPIAASSAIFDSMGRIVVISGVQGIDPDKTCSFHDVAWPCGQRARAAFNSWLRGRALSCVLPPQAERFAIAAPCRLGTQDAGAWLVSNGWATALPNGIYGKAEVVARGAEMGVFGPPQ
jgi:hypothetical protein